MKDRYYLHDLLKHTNIDKPMSDISYDVFPEQDLSILYTTKEYHYYEPAFIPITPPNEEDSHKDTQFKDRIRKGMFTNIRYDLNEEVSVLISTGYDKTIVTRRNICKDFIVVPVEKSHLIGLRVYNTNYPVGAVREGYILDIQAIEPGFAVIAEYIDSTYYRIILDTEMVFEYNPDDIHIPVKEPDLSSIRKRILEGRVPYQYESNNSNILARALSIEA